MSAGLGRREFVGAAALLFGGCVTGPRLATTIVRSPPIWGPLVAGPYAAGLTVDWIGGSQRRVQRWTWSPVVSGSGRSLTVGELGSLYVGGAPAGWPTDPRAIYATGYDEPGDVEKYAKLLDLEVASRSGARSAPGVFPLVVLGQGFAFESPFHQLVLAEYLATWGFRVVTAPLVGARDFKADVSPGTLAQQVDDLALLSRSVSHDRGLTFVGYDLGGMAAVALAASGRVRPDLVVGIDSGVILEKLTDDLLQSRADFDWGRLTMPYIHVTRSAAENKLRGLDEDLTIFGTGKGAYRGMVRIPQMRHADFGTIGALEAVYPNGYGAAQGKPALGYASMAYLILDGLRHYVGQPPIKDWTPLVRPPISLERWPKS